MVPEIPMHLVVAVVAVNRYEQAVWFCTGSKEDFVMAPYGDQFTRLLPAVFGNSMFLCLVTVHHCGKTHA